jgi:hypothetical protein
LAEKCNDLLQRILKKISNGVEAWPLKVQPAAFELNRREIVHLGHTPYEIHFGYQPPSALEVNFPSYSRQATIEFLKHEDTFERLDEDTMREAVFQFMVKRIDIHTEVNQKSGHTKALQKERYDKGVVERNYKVGNYVMLYDKKSAKKKLHAAYRGPFIVTGFAGDHGKSYTLRQIDSTPIPRSYSGDQLKLFKPRTDHLVTKHDESLKLFQNIRAGKANCRLPRELRDVSSQSVETLNEQLTPEIEDLVLGFNDLEVLLNVLS